MAKLMLRVRSQNMHLAGSNSLISTEVVHTSDSNHPTGEWFMAYNLEVTLRERGWMVTGDEASPDTTAETHSVASLV